MTHDPDDLSTLTIDRPQTLEVASVELHVVEGPDTGLRARLPAGTARLGTGAPCRLRLTDPTVSRFHCETRIEPGGLRIVDSNSRNGTYVDGVRIFDAALVSGATVRLGATAIRVELGNRPMHVVLSQRDGFGEVVGGSAAMRLVYALMDRVAPTDTTVLVQGETGTGKELVARAIHEASRRAQAPFITVDCGAIAENLIESELFGHTRGAFSGAVGDRKGLFEAAHGGTLFLDEIGELPLSLQPKLLRVLETRQVRRVGENTTRPVDVRVLAATNRSLAQSVNEGTFREDLYYRLAVVELTIPPLRARRDDIVPIARHFFARFAGPDVPFPDELSAALMTREWPGNVRELRNFIDRSVSLGWIAPATSVGAAALPQAGEGLEALIPTHLPMKEARTLLAEHFERLYVTTMLRKTGGNVTRAAELAGVNRRYLQRLIAELGLRGG